MKKKQKHRKSRSRRLYLILIIIALALAIHNRNSLPCMNSTVTNQNSIYNSIMKDPSNYPDKLIDALESNKELADFVYHYPEREQYMNKKISVKAEMKKNQIPLFFQWDKRWGYERYGKTLLGLSGCGPTCLSMVIIGLTQNDAYTPDVVAHYSTKNGYLSDGNTTWSLMTEGAGHFGINGEEIPLDEQIIKNYLKDHQPIICSMRPGDFTTTGHFIVLTGINNDDIVVNDPNSQIRSEQTWSFSRLQTQIKNLWVFTKN